MTAPFACFRSLHARLAGAAAVLALGTAPLSAQAVTIAQSNFPTTFGWTTQVVTSDPNVTFVGIDVGASGGNPGSYLGNVMTRGAVAAGVTTTERVAVINTLFTYDPAFAGALDRIDYRFDTRVVRSNVNDGSAGFLRPIIRQNGRIFSQSGPVSTLITGTGWSSASYSFLSSATWAQSGGGAFLPDFSATGGLIEFGYRLDYLLTCTGPVGSQCTALDVASAMDNISIQAFSATTTTAPEPATWVLLASGLAGLTLLRRRSSRPRA